MARIVSSENIALIEQICQRYPTRMAALLPALHLVQQQLGFISEDAQLDIAEILDVPPTRVYEVVTFYSMFHDKPMGRHMIKICRNLPCQLRGADALIAHAEHILNITCGQTTPDGRITLEHEECLASCGTAPMMWCDGRLVENLDEAKLTDVMAALV